jgi:hypothetical protein
MAVLSDDTVTGSGDLNGYQPAPLTLYVIITDYGLARTLDVDASGLWFDIGWFEPYFILDPVGLGGANYQFEHTFIAFPNSAFSLHQYTGGLDGIHYDLGNGVECRFVLTDD